jgi:predicted branched-subunit amino acid permease
MTDHREPALLWALRGTRAILSVPAFILLTSMAGFGVLCREAGLSLGQAVFTTAAIWALPSQVVLVGAITGGASLATAAVGVALSAIRFVPMLAAWAPAVRTPQTPRWQVVVLSHFVAVTSWVVAMTRLPRLPPEARLPYFAGFAVTLTTTGTLVTGASFALAGTLPAILAGLLFFLTPIYFLTALSASARLTAERLALVFGLALGPLMRVIGLPLDLVWAGLAGGTLGWLGHRLARRRWG